MGRMSAYCLTRFDAGGAIDYIMLTSIYAGRAILTIYILLLELNFCLSSLKRERMLGYTNNVSLLVLMITIYCVY